MSSTDLPTPPSELPRDRDLYLRWILEYLGLELSGAQAEVVRAIREHQYVLVVGANGFGKTYAVTAAALAFLFCHYPSKVVATSGTYGKLRRTMCRPLERLHKDAQDRYGIPGEYKNAPPRLEFDANPEWFFEATRPRDAGELEGTHSPHLMSIVEEADKENVTEDVLDSMGSLLTDDRDRMVVIANPPEERANIVAELMDDDSWYTLQYSSFESHNIGRPREEFIEGLVTLQQIESDWEAWNREPWPGEETARVAHEERDDLDVRWYRRRAGVIPADAATTHRPITAEDVEAAYQRDVGQGAPEGFGIDVARAGGDRTVCYGKHGPLLVEHGAWRDTDHNENEARLREILGEYPARSTLIDAQGEGSALADRLTQAYPEVSRFNAGAKPVDQQAYYDRWSEGLHLLGTFLARGGSFNSRALREELLVAARVVAFSERHLDSREATVLKATSKEKVKDALGRSPDLLDAAYMAVTAAETDTALNVGVAFG